MGKTNINLVVDDELLEQLQNHCRGNRNGYRSAVSRAHPVDGVEVTMPDDQAMDSGPHVMTVEELIEWYTNELAHNRVGQF